MTRRKEINMNTPTISEIFLNQSLDINRWSAIDSQAHNISGPIACLRSHISPMYGTHGILLNIGLATRL